MASTITRINPFFSDDLELELPELDEEREVGQKASLVLGVACLAGGPGY